MTKVIEFLEDNPYITQILYSILWLIIIMVIINLINRLLYRTIQNNERYYNTRKRIYYIFSTIYIIILLLIWARTTVNWTTYIGLVSAGLAIALKDIFSNIAGWLFLMLRRPFEVGDRICIGDHGGDVIDIRMFQFALMEVHMGGDAEQSTGRIIDVPNGFIFIYPVINYNKGFQYIWNEIDVLITFESNWRKTKSLLTDIVNKNSMHLSGEADRQVKEAARRYMIHYNNLTPIVYLTVKESGVLLTMRYLCPPKQRRSSVEKIWENVLNMVEENEDINLAYPTYRITS